MRNDLSISVIDIEAKALAILELADHVRVSVDDSHISINLAINELAFVEVVLLINKSADTVWHISNSLTCVRTFPVCSDQENLNLDIFLPSNCRILGGWAHVVFVILLHLVGHSRLFISFKAIPNFDFLWPIVSFWILGCWSLTKEVNSFLRKIVSSVNLLKQLLSLNYSQSGQNLLD